MSGLIINLRHGDHLLIGGAQIMSRGRSSILMRNHARFVFGHQVMLPEDVSTPLDRLHLAIQDAHLEEDDDPPIVAAAVAAAECYPQFCDELKACIAHAAECRYFPALKLVLAMKRQLAEAA